ncbi:DUF2971 domain-containing protein [Duganella sp. HH101]|uniref:DUF2971 domain-containing protein n=1 Tax=Duganella sp. HH101 TaxID=1781066 RepID=UPI000893AC76|nr:DUF2971 domain-containing protein [Duganella sp. HH101]OFA02441.1 hypothetical protein DUGA2_37850 [Duganella sp. HH101]
MPTIYHYCDTNAFLSIVERDILWLSSVFSMNDLGEMSFFGEKVLPAILKSIDNNPDIHSNRELTDQRAVIKNAMENVDCYSLCFSENDDDLYQWQAYGCRGKGISIGFDSYSLCDNHVDFNFKTRSINVPRNTNSIPDVELARVNYVKAEQVAEYADMLRSAMWAITPTGEEQGSDPLTRFMLTACKLIKSTAFDAEREHRLMYSPSIIEPVRPGDKEEIKGILDKRKWRMGAYGITPYFEYPEKAKEAIREVTIGPSSLETVEKVQAFLRSQGLSDVKVTKSASTLR